MKTGDKVPVNIAGDVVAQATVSAIDKENNTVTLIVPATKVVMGLRVEIDTTPPPSDEADKQVIITGVDRVDEDGNIIEGKSTGEPAPAGETAPVVETQTQDTNTVETGATSTPVGEATQTELVEPQNSGE